MGRNSSPPPRRNYDPNRPVSPPLPPVKHQVNRTGSKQKESENGSVVDTIWTFAFLGFFD